jgi:uncharacterized RDD family membrane protein YckC
VMGPNLGLRPAPFFKRLGALLIDCAIVLTPLTFLQNALLEHFTPYFTALLEQLKAGDNPSIFPTLGILFAILFVVLSVFDLYFLLFEYYRSATPGKKILGLKVVSLVGTRLTLGQCVWREIFRHIDCTLVLPGLISVLVTKRHQRLGDLVAHTLVADAKTPSV